MSSKVLIVDDDKIIIFLNSRILQQSGISDSAVSFENGQLALDFLQEHCKPEDLFLVFLDLNMPVMDGWTFLENLHQCSFYSQVFVVVVSSSTDTSDHVRAQGYSQVIEFIEKPFEIAEAEKIKQMLKSRLFFD